MKKTWEEKFDAACSHAYSELIVEQGLPYQDALLDGFQAILYMARTEKSCSFSFCRANWHIFYTRKKKKFSPKEDFILEVIKSERSGYTGYDTEDYR